MKIRILSNPEQKKVLQKWTGATRFLKERRGNGENPNKKRRALLVSEKMIPEKDSRLKDVPNCVRQGGVIQLVNAHFTNFSKKKKEQRSSFRDQLQIKKESIDRDH